MTAVPGWFGAEDQGAGIAAAQLVTDNRVDAVLTGFVGPNAFNALRACNIKVFEGVSIRDSVREALNKFLKDSYREASGTSSKEECRPARGKGRGGGRCRPPADK